ncbi:MAG: prolipoprotein diacylglyceryl transferase [Xanthomonadaceae bacterium]|nr:prolipoprotein diacylglyceryl transferase [Xanthomonadaceae bacterium]
MHPLLFNMGPVPIHSYGLLIAIGFLSALEIIRRLSIKSKLPVDPVMDIVFWMLISGFIGARLLFVITRFDYFAAHPLEIIRVWEGGLVFFGGLITATAVFVFQMRKSKLPIWKVADVLVPGLVLNHAFGRLGCLAAGCCYGKPTDLPWGIHLHSELVERSLRGVSLHPVQLYEAGSLLLLLFGLLWIFKHKKFDGQVGISYFIIYPVIRSIVELFRGDFIRGFIIDPWLSTSQFISLFVVVGSLCVLLLRLKRVRAPR